MTYIREGERGFQVSQLEKKITVYKKNNVLLNKWAMDRNFKKKGGGVVFNKKKGRWV